MGVKVYVSGISGNKEVKKRQQRVLMILDSRNIKYDVVDIAEPDNEEEKDFMQNNSTSTGATVSDASPRHPLPPQIFNDAAYCGDYDQFDMSNEIDELEKFLKLAPDDAAPTVTSNAEIKLGNGEPEHNTVETEEEIKDKESSPTSEAPTTENEVAEAGETTNETHEHAEKVVAAAAAVTPAEETNGVRKLEDEEEQDEKATVVTNEP